MPTFTYAEVQVHLPVSLPMAIFISQQLALLSAPPRLFFLLPFGLSAPQQFSFFASAPPLLFKVKPALQFLALSSTVR